MADRGTTLTTREAAAYVRSSYNQFLREVAAGVWPQPIAPGSRPMKWSKPEIDARLKIEDDSVQSTAHNPNHDELDQRLGLK